jgi:uracil-DNA glycosylase
MVCKLTLNEDIEACKKCEISKFITHKVISRGTAETDLDILFIGEAPGHYEDIQGKPFVGASGQLLNKMIAELMKKKLNLKYAIINTLKCRPTNNRPPTLTETERCQDFFWRQVWEYNPKIIVPLGITATRRMLPHHEAIQTMGMFQLAGTITISPNPYWNAEYNSAKQHQYWTIYPIPHPSYFLRNGSTGWEGYIQKLGEMI